MLSSVVVAQFGPALTHLRWEPSSTLGFSGARVWRGDADGIALVALKAYPPESLTVERLSQIHDWLNSVAGLAFVPRLLRTPEGASFVFAENRFWDALTWRPGRADFHEQPSLTRLKAACVALAKLHRVWQRHTMNAPIPGITRRFAVLAESESSEVPCLAFEPALAALLLRAREQVRRLRGPAEAALSPWKSLSFRVHPCLCDVWHDHVQFTGDEVTGVIDYGAMRWDHAAIDLARLLGSLVPGDEDAFTAGIEAYRREVALDVPNDLVMLLAETGILGSVAGWLVRFASSEYVWPNAGAMLHRLERLVSHLEKLRSPSAFLSGAVPFSRDSLLQ